MIPQQILVRAFGAPESDDGVVDPHADARDALFFLGSVAHDADNVRFNPRHTLILFTSDRRKEAEALYAQDPKHYALIHTTRLGALMEEAKLFNKLPGEEAYLAWTGLAGKLIAQNRPRHVVIVGNPQNETSTLWNFELPLLLKLVPDCRVMDYDTRTELSRADLRNLCRPHFDVYMAAPENTGVLADKWRASGVQMTQAHPVEAQRILGYLRHFAAECVMS